MLMNKKKKKQKVLKHFNFVFFFFCQPYFNGYAPKLACFYIYQTVKTISDGL